MNFYSFDPSRTDGSSVPGTARPLEAVLRGGAESGPQRHHRHRRTEVSLWEQRARLAVRPKLNWLGRSRRWGGARALQIFCGSGLVAEGMLRRGADVTAVDFRTELLERARAHSVARGYRVDYRHLEGPLSQLFAPESFDVVVCDHVFEWHPQRAQVLAEAHAVLRPGGTLMFACLNSGLRAGIARRVARTTLLPGLPQRRRLRAVPPRTMRAMLTDAGFQPDRMTGLGLRGWDFIQHQLHYRTTYTMGGIYLGTALKP